MNVDIALARLVRFRCTIHASLAVRPDALFEMIDGLLQVRRIRSAVEVSLAPAFRRCFHSVYEALREGRMDLLKMRRCLAENEPADAVTVGGYAVYATDTTIAPRPDAETLPDRGMQHSRALGKSVPGYQYSWLVRVLGGGHSWVAPRDVERVSTKQSAGEVAGRQAQRLDASAAPEGRQAVVGDGGYSNKAFLRSFRGLTRTAALVRLRSNQTLYGAPPPKEPGKGGRPRKHGEKVWVKNPPPPDVQTVVERQDAKGKPITVRLSGWKNLHLKQAPEVVGLLLRVQVFKADGTPMHKQPLWLFWTGDQDLALEQVLDMYLLRFNIEHFFRFGKQELGLLACQGVNPEALDRWVWAVALAYWMLLLGREAVERNPVPWDPAPRRDPGRPMTPGQVLAGWQKVSGHLGTPAAPPKRCGKAPGRRHGFHPKPRKRHPVVRGRRNKTQDQA